MTEKSFKAVFARLQELTRSTPLVCVMAQPFTMGDVFQMLAGPIERDHRVGIRVSVDPESADLWRLITEESPLNAWEFRRQQFRNFPGHTYEFDVLVNAIRANFCSSQLYTSCEFGYVGRQPARGIFTFGSSRVGIQFMPEGVGVSYEHLPKDLFS